MRTAIKTLLLILCIYLPSFGDTFGTNYTIRRDLKNYLSLSSLSATAPITYNGSGVFSLDYDSNDFWLNGTTLEVNDVNVNHGSLYGLGDDDHTQYLLASGTRALAGNWSLGGYNLTNGGSIACTGLTDSGLTSGRVPYASTGGLITDSSTFTFSPSTSSGLTISGILNIHNIFKSGGAQVLPIIDIQNSSGGEIHGFYEDRYDLTGNLHCAGDGGSYFSFDDSSTNTVVDILKIKRSTSGAAPAAGIGSRLAFHLEDAGGVEEQASIDTVLTDVTNNAEYCDLVFRCNRNGTMTEYARFDSSADNFDLGAKNILTTGSITSDRFITPTKMAYDSTHYTQFATAANGTTTITNVGIADYSSPKLVTFYQNNNNDLNVLFENGNSATASYITNKSAGAYASNNFIAIVSAVSQEWAIGMFGDKFFRIKDGTANKYPFQIAATAPDNSFYMPASGKIGLGAWNPQSTLDVVGNVSIGTYAGVTAAPANGMIISGNVGIGKNNPSCALDVTGAGLISTTLGVTGLTTATGGIATPKGAITLAAGATAIAATKSFHVITGDGAGNTVATITGGSDGMILRLLFVDALVTITNTDAHTANTVDLSAAFTSADDTVLTLIFDSVSWYEISRSVN